MIVIDTIPQTPANGVPGRDTVLVADIKTYGAFAPLKAQVGQPSRYR